jgi:hypothetical protein
MTARSETLTAWLSGGDEMLARLARESIAAESIEKFLEGLTMKYQAGCRSTRSEEALDEIDAAMAQSERDFDWDNASFYEVIRHTGYGSYIARLRTNFAASPDHSETALLEICGRIIGRNFPGNTAAIVRAWMRSEMPR